MVKPTGGSELAGRTGELQSHDPAVKGEPPGLAGVRWSQADNISVVPLGMIRYGNALQMFRAGLMMSRYVEHGMGIKDSRWI